MTEHPASPATAPGSDALVSIVMANHCGARYLPQAIRSVLAQTHANLELILVDDASSDNSLEIIRALAAADSRVKLIALPHNRGPGAARNQALAAAQGQWIAIVDADDLIEPERLSQLLDLAGEYEADILADDLTYFVENREPHGRLLAGLQLARPTIIPPETLITGRSARGVAVAFGYLKPLFRRELTNAVRYDETLRIGEDFDLLLRMVLNGARLCVTPQSFYRYRRHASSISHRLSSATAQAMLHSHERLMQDYKDASPSIGAAFQRHHRALSEQLAYELLVEAIKRRQFGPACRALLRQPALVTRLLRSMRERWSRAAPRREQVSS